MKQRKKVGIFGGTFDPPHVGHLIIAEFVREEAGLDSILFMPAFQPPHKTGFPGATASQRLAMTRLAIRGNRQFACSNMEVQRQGTSYTVDTIEQLVGLHPESAFSLVIGMDSYIEFASWKSPDRIVEVVSLIVYPRLGMGAPPAGRFNRHAEIISAPLLEISSSLVRRRLSSGKSVRHLVPEAVIRYIHRHKLYRT